MIGEDTGPDVPPPDAFLSKIFTWFPGNKPLCRFLPRAFLKTKYRKQIQSNGKGRLSSSGLESAVDMFIKMSYSNNVQEIEILLTYSLHWMFPVLLETCHCGPRICMEAPDIYTWSSPSHQPSGCFLLTRINCPGESDSWSAVTALYAVVTVAISEKRENRKVLLAAIIKER